MEVGDIGQLPEKGPEEVVFRRNRKDGWKVTSEKTAAWVSRSSDREVIAFAPMCTHLGCAYPLGREEASTSCVPCHTSASGSRASVEGPAPRPLDRYEVRIEGAKLLLGPWCEARTAG